MRRLSLRKFRWLIQGHTTPQWWIWGSIVILNFMYQRFNSVLFITTQHYFTQFSTDIENANFRTLKIILSRGKLFYWLKMNLEIEIYDGNEVDFVAYSLIFTPPVAMWCKELTPILWVALISLCLFWQSHLPLSWLIQEAWSKPIRSWQSSYVWCGSWSRLAKLDTCRDMLVLSAAV